MSFWDKMKSTFTEIVNDRKIKDNQLADEVRAALRTYDGLWKNDFVDPEEVNEYKLYWYNVNALVEQKVSSFLYHIGVSWKDFKEEANDFLTKYKELNKKLAAHNTQIAKERIEEARRLILPVEGCELDKQQLMSIVKEARNHVVLAGAGTGKTTTIIGYLKYLLFSGKAKPEDILVLSFTNASASEMQERVLKETNVKMDISTFHKLGLNIMTNVDGKKPLVTSVDLRRFCRDRLDVLIKNSNYSRLLIKYLLNGIRDIKSEFDFESKSEYDEYLQDNPPTSIDKKIYKSFGEMDIANFLYQNSVKYEYEKAYSIDTRTEEYGQYYPDFYLPDNDIYIEFFGINREGKVPNFFSSRLGKTPTEEYQASMKWKRELHKKNNTTMIEIYAYERMEDTHLEKLKNELIHLGVTLVPKDPEQILNEIWEGKNQEKDRVAELFSTIISLLKSNDSTIQEIHERNESIRGPKSNDVALQLIQPIYDDYQKYLSDHKEIDFNDMINQACCYVREGKYRHHYGIVIIDEYQDISQSRFKLLDEMRRQNDYKLFCVGDDWQSIYRFSGSDIGFILNFEKYWGPSLIDRIETTYRFSQELIDITGAFIMKNPEQKRKMLVSLQDIPFFPMEKIQGFNEEYAIQFMTDKLNDLPRNSSVLFLGRYRFDVDLLKKHPDLDYKYYLATATLKVYYRKRQDLQMSFMTAHGSKGLQADYVFILNNKKRGMGFPSQVSNPPIMRLLLDNCDHYPFAEERRLFYVALTRAKKKVFLVTVKNNESSFVEELDKEFGEEMKKEQYRCPLCGGRLLRKKGNYGAFFGCSNYKELGCKYTRKIG